LSLVGLVSSLVSLVIMVYPIIDVADPGMYAAKICAVVVVSNILGVAIYKSGQRRSRRQEALEDSEILRPTSL
jgi:L-cystine uptake protein TcyP (sodium:dicarboxylate symporter family)